MKIKYEKNLSECCSAFVIKDKMLSYLRDVDFRAWSFLISAKKTVPVPAPPS